MCTITRWVKDSVCVSVPTMSYLMSRNMVRYLVFHAALSNFQIGTISFSPEQRVPTPADIDVCVSYRGTLSTDFKMFECRAESAYRVIIQPTRGVLSLCEVEVFGGRKQETFLIHVDLTEPMAPYDMKFLLICFD